MLSKVVACCVRLVYNFLPLEIDSLGGSLKTNNPAIRPATLDTQVETCWRWLISARTWFITSANWYVCFRHDCLWQSNQMQGWNTFDDATIWRQNKSRLYKSGVLPAQGGKSGHCSFQLQVFHAAHVICLTVYMYEPGIQPLTILVSRKPDRSNFRFDNQHSDHFFLIEPIRSIQARNGELSSSCKEWSFFAYVWPHLCGTSIAMMKSRVFAQSSLHCQNQTSSEDLREARDWNGNMLAWCAVLPVTVLRSCLLIYSTDSFLSRASLDITDIALSVLPDMPANVV